MDNKKNISEKFLSLLDDVQTQGFKNGKDQPGTSRRKDGSADTVSPKRDRKRLCKDYVKERFTNNPQNDRTVSHEDGRSGRFDKHEAGSSSRQSSRSSHLRKQNDTKPNIQNRLEGDKENCDEIQTEVQPTGSKSFSKVSDKREYEARNKKLEEGDSRKNRVMGFKFLESMLERDTGFVVTTLASSRSGFQELFIRPIRPDLLILLIRVLNKVNEYDIHHLKLQILSDAFKPEFVEEVKSFVSSVCLEEKNERLKQLPTVFKNLLDLFESVINFFPSIMSEKFKRVLIALSMSMKHVKSELDIGLQDGLFEQLKIITEQVDSFLEDKKKIDEQQNQYKSFKEEAPNNFRDLLVIPTKEDFMSQGTFLRPNIVRGCYKDCEHYLDTQFRLLREDFIGPLREGIHEYIESLNAPHLKRKYSNVRIYPKVQFLGSSKARNKHGFLIKFDCDKRLPRNINWEYSKRLLVGSLLLFSDDDFHTFYLATVADRDTKNLDAGNLLVDFLSENETPKNIFEPGTYFVMAESEVYYEAYRPVLIALKMMNEKNFPMKQYIIEVGSVSFPPNYIVDRMVYKISRFEFNLFNDDEWPSSCQLNLNESQYKAFKSALTDDFAVIQGPPGTGKTFLALKVAEVLLKNNISEKTPIIVICYTNHALDQFLEGILKFTQNLIRIGSRSQNESLQKFNIDQIRAEIRKAKLHRPSEAYWETIHEKSDISKQLEMIEARLELLSSFEGIVELSELESVITPQHFNELNGQEVDWLLFKDLPDQCALPHENVEGQDSPKSKKENLPPENDNEQDSSQSKEKIVDAFDQMSEFNVEVEQNFEEVDDDENKKRLADMTEDDFYDDEIDFGDLQDFSKPIQYSLKITQICQNIDVIENDLLLSKPQDEMLPTYYYVQERMKEQIKDLNWQKDFVTMQFIKFKDFKFNPEKLTRLQNITNVWEINPEDRWELYVTWVHLYCCQLKQTIQQLTYRYQNVLMKFNELKQLEDSQFVRNAAVVGLTTSGASKRRVLLESLDTKIVIVEEAAEVLEAHIVTSLTKSVQHLILIGDHKQLKPSPAVYKLAKKYNMDISLFERMINNGLHCSLLDTQHRMRPEIASLVSPTIYPSLINHPSTLDRPKISGIDKFVFFLAHNHPEDQVQDSASRQNKFEGDFLIQLCNYLLNQGYPPDKITILATYSGQVWYMRKEKRRMTGQNADWRNVRITPVDNFQGEENDIILLSLVRSNKEGKIGFLSTENRVCVALSRARNGFYIVGNMDNLVASSGIWPKVKEQLDKINAVGSQLMLRCERHPEQVVAVSSARDFSAVPEGGCKLMCEFRLTCGHTCPRICHIKDREHQFYQCRLPCDRPPCEVEGHRCPLECCKPCEPCKIKVDKRLPCGHSARLRCHEEPAAAKCMQTVPAVLPTCGHSVDKFCYLDVSKCLCPEPCTARLPCGHACLRTCHVSDDPDHLQYKCMKDCPRPNAKCRRNHKCPKHCYEECGDCMEKVLTELPCGHRMGIPCSKDAKDITHCSKPCKKILPCNHQCTLLCWVPCQPEMCKKIVDKEGPCGHMFKNMKCSEPTSTRQCKSPCTRTLACGHECTQLCHFDCAKVLCQEPVPSIVSPACGHPPVMVPCHINKPGLKAGSDELLQLCKETCGRLMDCGHLCKGTCGSCLSGRLHVPCTERCTLRLLCGHQCKGKCNDLCPPCRSNGCYQNCNHEKCNKKNHSCSTPCEPCTKPCMCACDHDACGMQCGVECGREPCDDPCKFELKCGHLCVGFCGEVHPPLCRVCDTDTYLVRAHPAARFVLLEDCNHVVVASQLDQLNVWETDRVPRLLECPVCKAPIVKTRRYRNSYIRLRSLLNRINTLVNQEKTRLFNFLRKDTYLLTNNVTTSPSMNSLLSSCLNGKGGMGSTVVGCLLLPLAKACEQNRVMARVKDPLSGVRVLSTEEEQRLRLRLEYLASALKLRMQHISYHDVLRAELEVARTLRAMAKPQLSYLWYKTDRYSWAEDNVIMRNHNLQPLEKFSSTLKTRHYDKLWFQCERKHLYVDEEGKSCANCAEEDREKEKRREREIKNQSRAGGSHNSGERNPIDPVLRGDLRNYRHQSHMGEDAWTMKDVRVTDYRKQHQGPNRGRGRGGKGRGRGSNRRGNRGQGGN